MWKRVLKLLKSKLLFVTLLICGFIYRASDTFTLHESIRRVRNQKISSSSFSDSNHFTRAPTDSILEEFEAFLKREPESGQKTACSSHSGKAFWDQLKARKVQVCGGKVQTRTEKHRGRVTCYPEINNHFGFCHSQNTILINTDSKPLMVFKDCQKNSNYQDVKNNFLNDESVFKLLHSDNAKLIEGAVESLAKGCRNVINHPVFFYQRYDTTNMYHSNEDFTTAFVSLNAASLDANLKKAMKMSGGIEIVITDSHSKGFYLRFWERIGNKRFPIRFLKERPFPEGTCFKNALYSAQGGISLLSGAPLAQPVDCSSYVLQAYSQWVRLLLADHVNPGENRYKWHVLEEETTQNTIGQEKIHQILFTTRARFERTHMLPDWQSSRHLDNEDELIQAIQKLVLDRNRKACLAGGSESNTCQGSSDIFEFQVLEFSDLTFREQLDHTLKTDIYLGVHGAALAHSLYLKPNSSIIEIVPPVQAGNYHFQHIGRWLDLDYKMISCSEIGAAPIEEILKAIQNSMDRLSNTH